MREREFIDFLMNITSEGFVCVLVVGVVARRFGEIYLMGHRERARERLCF